MKRREGEERSALTRPLACTTDAVYLPPHRRRQSTPVTLVTRIDRSRRPSTKPSLSIHRAVYQAVESTRRERYLYIYPSTR